MPDVAACPDLPSLQRFLRGPCAAGERESLAKHLEQCDRCLSLLHTMQDEHGVVEAMRSHGKPQRTASPGEGTVDAVAQASEEGTLPPSSPPSVPQASDQTTLPPSAASCGPGAGLTLSRALPSSAGTPGETRDAVYDFLAPPQNPGELGRLGPYHVLKVLGAGGMGVVFQAHDPHLERSVALKAMLPTLAASAASKQRFLREAKAAAAIKHDHIVTIYQVGEDRGVPFLAMELLEGESLDDRLKREGKLWPHEVLRIGRELAEGLAAAHKRGLIHRDVKPGNVWLEGQRARVKILDFGLVRLASDDGDLTLPDGAAVTRTFTDDAHLTQAGAIVGTPAFMAPEQADGKPVDARCDLFSLGCVLYQMATGQLPFQGRNMISTLMAVTTETPPSPEKLNPELPPELSALVMQLLAKDPAERPASASRVVWIIHSIEALAQKRTAEGTVREAADSASYATLTAARVAALPDAARRPVVRPSPGRFPLLGAAVAVLLVAAACTGAAFLFFLSPAPASTEPPRAVLPNVSPFGGPAGQLAIDADVPELHLVVKQGGRVVRTLDTRTSPLVDLEVGDYEVEPAEANELSITPNKFTLLRGGRQAVEVRRAPGFVGEIRRIDMGGLVGGACRMVFCPDGRHAITTGGSGVPYVWDVNTGQATFALRGHHLPNYVWGLAVSCDGSNALTGGDDFNLCYWNLTSGELIRRFPSFGDSQIFSVALHPDGRRAASPGSGGAIVLWDLVTGKEVRRFLGHLDQVEAMAFSLDGRLLASRGNDQTVRLWDVEKGSELRRYDGCGGWGMGVTFSPDDKFLLVGCHDATMHLWEVESGKEVRRFEGHVGLVQSAVFSRDGRLILSGGADKTVRLWDVASGKELHRFTGHDQHVDGVGFSPDGRLALSYSNDGTLRLWQLPMPIAADGGKASDSPGQVVVESDAPEVPIDLKQGGNVVKTLDPQSDPLMNLKPGEYEVEPAAGHEGVRASPDKFTLAAGGQQIVRVRWAPLLKLAQDPKRTEAADEALKALLAREADPQADKDRLRTDLLDFDRNYSGTSQTLRTAELLKRLPSPLDSLKREKIPEEELATVGGGDPRQAPAGLVAILGDNRLKHWDAALGVAFSPDGRMLASAGRDGQVNLWEASSGRLLRSLTGHDGWAIAVKFSPDGLTLASAGADHTVRLWEVQTGKNIAVLRGHDNVVNAVAFSPDGKMMASASWDKTIKLWDVALGKEVKTLTGHSDEVRSVAFSLDGKWLASGSKDGAIRLWGMGDGNESRILDAQQGEVRSVAFNSAGDTLATSAEDGLVKLWAMPSGSLARTLKGHRGGVYSVAFSPDGTTVASAGFDNTVKLWDAKTGDETRMLKGHSAEVHCVTFDPSGRLLASASFDRTVRIWDVNTGKEASPPTGGLAPVNYVKFSPDGAVLAVAGHDGTVKLFSTATGEKLRTLTGHQGDVWNVTFSPDGRVLAMCGQDYTIKLWDAVTGEFLRTLKGHQGAVLLLEFSPDGRRLASGSWEDHAVKLWDAATGTELNGLTMTQPVVSLEFSPDGKTLLVGDANAIKLWEPDTGTLRRLTTQHVESRSALSRDGRLLVTWGRDYGPIEVQDPTQVREPRSLDGPGTKTRVIDLGPDGKTLAVTGEDGTVRLWDAVDNTPGEVFPLGSPGGRIIQSAFSPDGRYLATANWNGTVYILRLALPPEKAQGK